MRIRLGASRRLAGAPNAQTPSARAELQYTSARRMRLKARAPRMLAGAVAIALILAGLRTTVFGTPPPRIERIYEATSNDIGVEGFAETFARAYLTWSGSGHAQAYYHSLALYNQQFAEGSGIQLPSNPERVTWSRVLQDQPSALKDSRIVTVALQLTPGDRTCYLAVPVNRAQNGALAVTTWPSFVGPPAVQQAPAPPSLPAVTDPNLITVATRALTNYLAGDQNDLQADLAPGTEVAYPAQQLQVTGPPVSVLSTGPGGVLVTVRAADAQGASYTLAYEIGVEKTERWYVDSIEVIPNQ
jgi:hypothetical protein